MNPATAVLQNAHGASPQPSPTTPPQPDRSGRGAVIGSDFETFLRMLTTQMQNQDPLNPMDSAEFAVQLATFSGVEQQVKANQLLEGMMGLLGMSQLAGWVGMEVRAPVDANFDGSPITLSPNPLARADRAVLVVRDADGVEVSRSDIPLSSDPIEWAGVDSDGAPLPNGTYSFTLESMVNDEVIDSSKVEIYATVTEARGGGTGTVLVMDGGAQVAASDVTAIREPGRSTSTPASDS